MDKPDFYGWRLLAVFWLVLFVNLAFPAYGSSVVNTYMGLDLHLDRKMLGLPYTVYMLMSGLPAPLVAICVNRLGVRITLVLGSLLVITGSLVMALFVSTAFGAALAFGCLVGAGVATGGALATQTGVTYWFLRRRALALSILLSGGGIGGFVAAKLLNALITAFGGNWRMGWWLIAAMSTGIAVLVALTVKEKPADLGQQPDGVQVGSPNVAGSGLKRASTGRADPDSAAGAPAAATPPATSSATAPSPKPYITTQTWTYREAVTSPQFWLMMLATVSVSAGFTLILAHGLMHLKDLGHTLQEGTTALSVVTISTLLAKVIVAVLGDRMDPRYLWAAFILVFGVGLLLVVHATGPLDIYPFAICLGSGFGGMLVCQMAVLANYYGSTAYASVVGLALLIQTAVGASSPYVAGWLYDATGTYAGTFYFLAAACLISAAILLAVRPPVRRTLVPASADASRGSSAGVTS